MTNYEEYFAEGVGSFYRSMMLKESDGGTAHCPKGTAQWGLSSGYCPKGTVQWVLLNGYCPVGTAQRVLSNGYYSMGTTQYFSIFVNLAIKIPFTGAELL